MARNTSRAVSEVKQIPAGKVLSCPHQMTIRYRFTKRPPEPILSKLFDWLEEQRDTVANFHWLEDGWTVKVNIRHGRTDWLAELNADLTTYLRNAGFAAA